MAQQNLQWGVIGTGAIATDFATALQSSERCRIANVTSFPGQARVFADKFGVARATDSLDELLAEKRYRQRPRSATFRVLVHR